MATILITTVIGGETYGRFVEDESHLLREVRELLHGLQLGTPLRMTYNGVLYGGIVMAEFSKYDQVVALFPVQEHQTLRLTVQ
jgi:hypothetical protein